MVIRYISASDRINYGDLLFPIIFKQYFSKTHKIQFYGLIHSDYSNFGALSTRSYKELVKDINKSEDIIVVGGGEVFFGDWRNLYSYIYPLYSRILNTRIVNRLENKLNLYRLFFYRTRNEYPFLPNLGCDTVYIGSGGVFTNYQSIKEKKYIRSILKKSPFLSVRDNRTYNSLKENGVEAELIPDSAVLINKVFNKDLIKDKIINKSIFKFRNSDYIYLQVGRFKAPKDLHKFVDDINFFASKNNLKVVCCPIGYAPGHEDHIVLRRLCDIDPSWEYISANNIYEIMYLISKCRIYMGTSLHGLITAFSFLKPALALNKTLKKTSAFVETWCSEFYEQNIDYHEIKDKADSAFKKWDKIKAANQLEFCQNKVESYFKRIDEYIDSKNIKQESNKNLLK